MPAAAVLLQESEEFYACKWSVNVHTGTPLLLLAGKRGLLKVLDTQTEEYCTVSAADLLCKPPDFLLHRCSLCTCYDGPVTAWRLMLHILPSRQGAQGTLFD